MCNICGQHIGSEKLFERHVKNHADDNSKSSSTILCDVCGLIFDSESSLRYHLYTGHKIAIKPLLQCEFCDRQFYHKTQWRRHEEVHTLERARNHQCVECNQMFTTKANLKSHMRHRHSFDKMRRCPLCKQGLDSLMRLKHHIKRNHKVGAISKCSKCDGKFTTVNERDRHRRCMHRVKKSLYM